MKLFIKLVLEFTPLALLLIFTERYDVYVGSAALMIATVVSLALVWLLYRKVAVMAIITALTGLAAAGLTVYYTDPHFVKLKPTFVSLIFAGILSIGLIIRRPLLHTLLGEDLNLSEEGWRVLTGRWILYFVLIAVFNEVLWRGAEIIWHADPAIADRVWARTKVLGIMPFTGLYALCQVPVLRRYRLPAAPKTALLAS